MCLSQFFGNRVRSLTSLEASVEEFDPLKSAVFSSRQSVAGHIYAIRDKLHDSA
jgi:hypothetical protein